jgi:hypothetical protein
VIITARVRFHPQRIAMAGIRKTPALLDDLALALASGTTARAFSKKTGIPERTCYDWSRLPSVRDRVAEIRRRLVDATVGVLTSLSGRAARELGKLLGDPAPSIRLAAARAILEKHVDIANWSNYEARLAEMERQLGNASTPNQKTGEA